MSESADWEWKVLTETSGLKLLAELSENATLSVTQIERIKRANGPLLFEAALRVQKSRTKAKLKFPASETLWLDPVRVEQATHQAVATHKARRFAGHAVADICCGLGGDTMALAKEAKSVLAIDLDVDCLRRLSYNLEKLKLDNHVVVIQADANLLPLSHKMMIHVDPDRRAGDRAGRPRFQVDEYQPSKATLLRLMKNHPGGAIKLSPGGDFEMLETAANQSGIKTEIEIVSLGAECKEATLWFGSLAGGAQRSATKLPAGVTFHGEPRPLISSTHIVEQKPRCIFEVDPALARAGLSASLADDLQLQVCQNDGSYLSTLHFKEINSPWLVPFEVVEIVKPDRKAVRQALKRQNWPTAVVKTRGRLQADEACKWLDRMPGGLTRETLFLWTSPHQEACAILARRLVQAPVI